MYYIFYRKEDNKALGAHWCSSPLVAGTWLTYYSIVCWCEVYYEVE